MRPSIAQTMLEVAAVLAKRSTCVKAAVGCVLLSEDGEILGSGYNGVPKGYPHCTAHACPGAAMPTGSDTCCANHAETNALIRCAHPQHVYAACVTKAPCFRCIKELMATPCRILYVPVGEWANLAPQSIALWRSDNRVICEI